MKDRKDGRQCSQCNKPLPSNRTAYCSYECYAAHSKAQHRALNPFISQTSSGTTGAISELRVAAELLFKGYEVFRAVSPASSCDLAILKDNKLLRIEVRTSYYTASGNFYKNKGRLNKADIWAWALPDKIIYEPSLP